jgi:hypothetical protein
MTERKKTSIILIVDTYSKATISKFAKIKTDFRKLDGRL